MPVETLAEASRLLAQGLPFHAHEVLEEAWKQADSGQRDFWQGLAQLAVGITHAARGNRQGALALLRRGALRIAPYAPDPPHGMDVEAVLRWVEAASTSVSESVPVALPPPPFGRSG